MSNENPVEVDWKKRAKKRWPGAESIEGEGPIAVLAHCRDLTITLYENHAEANGAKEFIDKSACGGGCSPRRHEIVDMALQTAPTK